VFVFYISISFFCYISELQAFRLLLTKYHDQMDSVEQIVEEQALGILNLQLNQFKEAVLPSATDLLSIVEHTIPQYVPSIYILVVLLGVTTVYVSELYTYMYFNGIYYFL